MSTLKRHWRNEMSAFFAVASLCAIIFVLLSSSFNSFELCLVALVLGFIYFMVKTL